MPTTYGLKPLPPPPFVTARRVSHGAHKKRSSRAAVKQCLTVFSLPVGIDLGTTNSAIAICVDGTVRLLSDHQGRETVPSVVTYTTVSIFISFACMHAYMHAEMHGMHLCLTRLNDIASGGMFVF